MRILCVAEKPSIAKSIANTLGGGIVEARNSNVKFIRNYDFIYTFESWGNCQVTMTSVAGHISDLEFPPQYGWGKVRPIDLFEAPLRIRLLDGKVSTGSWAITRRSIFSTFVNSSRIKMVGKCLKTSKKKPKMQTS